jgi:transposase
MRVAPAIEIGGKVRTELERQARKRSGPVRVAVRSQIILLAADGLQNKQIAEQLHISTRMAAVWRGRFQLLGAEGLLKDAPRPGRTRSIPAAVVEQVITRTTQTTPVQATHWSTRTMAREVGISEASVRRIWRAHGLKPHRVESFKISNDPHFASKLEDISASI